MSNFKVGTLVTGYESAPYSYTNEKSLMVVIDTRSDSENDIGVKIIASSKREALDEAYYVKSNYFYITTFDEFYERVPEAKTYTLSQIKLDFIKKAYGFEEFITSSTKSKQEKKPYVLSDEMRKQLVQEMMDFLKQYKYHPTEDGVNKILDEWCLNKGDLIRLFEQHPNYNGKFQIQFDYDFSREIDKSGSYQFADYLDSLVLLKNVQVGAFTYHELRNICSKLSDIIEIFIYHDYVEAINGKTQSEYRSEYKHFFDLKKRYYDDNDDIVVYGRRAYKKQEYDRYVQLKAIIGILRDEYNITQFVTESTEQVLNLNIPGAKIKEGQRMSRAINKVLKMIGINTDPNYEKEFAKYADSVNPLKIIRHTVLSVHPIDYYTMSFGNSWVSCHSIDRRNIRGTDNTSGCGWSAGTESYMLDESSFLFYTIDSEYDGNQLELQDKINRNMFHYYDGQLLQARVYPQTCDEGCYDLYKDIREIVQKVIADVLQVPNLWTLKRGTSEIEKVTITNGRHYQDYLSFDNCNVSTLKGTEPELKIPIGHFAICPCCGNVHDERSNIECYICYNGHNVNYNYN